jgi:hypothetical protein
VLEVEVVLVEEELLDRQGLVVVAPAVVAIHMLFSEHLIYHPL